MSSTCLSVREVLPNLLFHLGKATIIDCDFVKWTLGPQKAIELEIWRGTAILQWSRSQAD